MKQQVHKLKNRIESNIIEVESYYSSIHMFLSQTEIIDEVDLSSNKVQKWLHDNRYTITIIEEILEKIEQKKSITA